VHVDLGQSKSPALNKGLFRTLIKAALQRLPGRQPGRRLSDSRMDPIKISLFSTLPQLMTNPPGVEQISQGVVKATEDHTATGKGLDGWQPKTLTDTPTPPIVSRIVKVDCRLIKELDEIIDPATLDNNIQAQGPKSRD
jgi:hypothetical protein